MFNKKNNKEEVIRMEQTTFIQRHYKKVIFAGSVVAGVYITHLLKKHDIEVDDLLKKHGVELNTINDKLLTAKEIGLRSLIREKANAECELAEKMEYINNLDMTLNINKFFNIPKAKDRIAELKLFIDEIDKDIVKLQD